MPIAFRKLSHTYNEGTPFAYAALKDIDLNIPEGRITAIIGETGSGKSTLVQHLNALLLPTQGELEVCGKVIRAAQKPKNLKELRKNVGLVFQFPEYQLFEETIEKDIAFGPKNFGVDEEEAGKTVRKVLPLVGLGEEYLSRSPFELSGGQKRRVAIAGILAMDPGVLVLDEPTAGLDPRQRIAVRNLIAEIALQKIVIVSTHVVPDVEYVASELLLLSEGRLLRKASPAELTHELAGQVWEAELAESELPAAQAAGTVCGIARVDAGHIRVRLLAEKQPPFACRPLAPELEDVYLHYFGAEDGL